MFAQKKNTKLLFDLDVYWAFLLFLASICSIASYGSNILGVVVKLWKF